MSAQQLNGVAMTEPREGFVNRVMARIAARERARTQRRAIAGIAVYALGAAAVLAVLFSAAGGDFAQFTFSNALETLIALATSLPLDLAVLVQALSTTLGAILAATAGVTLSLYALGAFGLTMLWVWIAIAPSKISLRGAR